MKKQIAMLSILTAISINLQAQDTTKVNEKPATMKQTAKPVAKPILSEKIAVSDESQPKRPTKKKQAVKKQAVIDEK